MRTIARSLTTAQRLSSRRTISSTSRLRSAGGGAHYNEPSGHLFGEKPLAAGEKRKWEDWELLWYVGMFGSMAVAAVGLYYKPDTSIQTWALQEARERLEARGENFEYKGTKASSAPEPSG